MTTTELHKLIERYFNAETTLAEERELRRQLANSSPGDRLADEAKAVMGFSLCAQTGNATHSSPLHAITTAMSAAAAIIVVVILCIKVVFPNEYTPAADNCYAYIDGKMITDQTTIIAIMESEIAQMAIASETMTDNIDNEWNAMQDAFSEIELSL